MPAHSPDPVHGAYPDGSSMFGDSGDLATEISEIADGDAADPRVAPRPRPRSGRRGEGRQAPRPRLLDRLGLVRPRGARRAAGADPAHRRPQPDRGPPPPGTEHRPLVRHRRPRPRHLQPHHLGRAGVARGRHRLDHLRPAHRRGHRPAGRPLPGQGRDRPHGLRRRAPVVPGPAAGPRHRRLPRRPHRAHHRARHRRRLHRPGGPPRAGEHARLLPTGVRGRRPVPRRHRRPHHRQGGHAQRDLPGDVVLGDRRRRRHRRRGRPGLPRPVGAAAHRRPGAA